MTDVLKLSPEQREIIDALQQQRNALMLRADALTGIMQSFAGKWARAEGCEEPYLDFQLRDGEVWLITVPSPSKRSPSRRKRGLLRR